MGLQTHYGHDTLLQWQQKFKLIINTKNNQTDKDYEKDPHHFSRIGYDEKT